MKAIHDHNLDIDKSFFIGDNETDYIAGETCNVKSYLYKFSESKLFNDVEKNSPKIILEPNQI